MTNRDAPHVTRCDYRDLHGKLIWTEPMVMARMDAIGDVIIHERVHYRVMRVALADEVQHVNLYRVGISAPFRPVVPSASPSERLGSQSR